MTSVDTDAESSARGALHGAMTAAHALLRGRRAPSKGSDPQLAKAVVQRDGALDEVTRLRSQVDRLQETVASLLRNRDADIAAVAESIEASSKRENATHLKEMKAAIEVLSTEVSNRDKKISELHKQLLQRSGDEAGVRAALQSKIDALTADILRRDAMLAERSKVFYTLNKELEKDGKLQQTAVEEYLRSQAAYDRLTEAKDALARELQLRDQELETAKAKISELANDMIDISLRHESMLAECHTEHRNNMDRLSHEFAQVKSELQNSIAELLQQNSDIIQKNEQLQIDVDDAKASHEELMEQLESVCAMSDALKHQLAAVESAKLHGEQENAELRRSIAKINSELQDLQHQRAIELNARDAELAKKSAAIDAARTLFLSSSKKVSEAAVGRRSLVQWMAFQSRCAVERMKAQEAVRVQESEQLAAKLSSLREEHQKADDEIARLSAVLSSQEAAANAARNFAEKARQEQRRIEEERDQQVQASVDQVAALTRRQAELEALVAERSQELEDARAALGSSRRAQDQLAAALSEATSRSTTEDTSKVNEKAVDAPAVAHPQQGAHTPSLTITHEVATQCITQLHLPAATQTLSLVQENFSASTQTAALTCTSMACQTIAEANLAPPPATRVTSSDEAGLKTHQHEREKQDLERQLHSALQEAAAAKEKALIVQREKSDFENRNRALVNDVRQAKDAFAAAMAELESVGASVSGVEQALMGEGSMAHNVRGASLSHRLENIRRQLVGLRTATSAPSEANVGSAERIVGDLQKSVADCTAGVDSTSKVDAQTWPVTSCLTFHEHDVLLHDARVEEREKFLSQIMRVADDFGQSAKSHDPARMSPEEATDSLVLIIHSSLLRAYELGVARRSESSKHKEYVEVGINCIHQADAPKKLAAPTEQAPPEIASASLHPFPQPLSTENAIPQDMHIAHNTGYSQLDRYLDALVLKHRQEIAVHQGETNKWRDRCEALTESQLKLERQVTLYRDAHGSVLGRLSQLLRSKALTQVALRTWCRWRLHTEQGRKEKMRAAANKTINSLVENQLKLKSIAASAIDRNRTLEEELKSATKTLQQQAAASAKATPLQSPRKTDKMTQAVDDAGITEARNAIASLRAEIVEQESHNQELSGALALSRKAEKELANENSELFAQNKRLQSELVAMRLELRAQLSAQSVAGCPAEENDPEAEGARPGSSASSTSH